MVFLLCVSLLAAGCGSSTKSTTQGGSGAEKLTASAPGVTTSTITIGTDIPLSGPVAQAGLALVPAFTAYQDYVNAHGGINGRKLKLVIVDNGYDPTTAIAAVKKLVEQDNVFAVFDNFGTPPVQATYQYLNQQGVPDIEIYAGDPPFVNPITKYTFELFPTYSTQGKVFGQYVKTTYPTAKVGVFYQNDGFGQPYKNGFDSVVGNQVVKEEPYDPTQVDFTSQIQALKSSGATVVACFCVFTPMAQLLKAAANGWSPKVVTSFGTGGQTIAGLAGTADSNGVVSDTFFPPADEASSNPRIAQMKQILSTYEPKATFNDITLVGMGAAQLLVEQLKEAGINPTRASLLKALTTRSFPGMWYGQVAMSDTNHNAWTCMELTKLENGQVLTFGSPTCTS